MPISLRLDRAKRLVVLEVEGNFSLSDSLKAIDTAIAAPGFERGFNVLSDHRRIAEPIGTDEMLRVISHLGLRAPQLASTRWAIVASQPASYGMMRMLSVHAKRVPLEVQVFRSRERAEAWLERME